MRTIDLSTTYMGIPVKNPIIIGASNLVADISGVQKAEEAGVGAIVYKSLFEEQIQLERLQLEEHMDEYTERHAEMITLFPKIEHAGPRDHLNKLKMAKESAGVPVIASLNAVNESTWTEYAKQIAQTGVDGLELNFYAVPENFDKDAVQIEEEQVNILKQVKNAVNIPVSVKLSSFYTNPLNVIKKFDEAGADAIIIFNRLFQPNIDIDKQEHVFPYNFSGENEDRTSLRFAGLLYGNVNADIIANTGIFNGLDAAKMILAGSDAVQVVSTIYKNGFSYLPKMLSELEYWMKSNNYASLEDFRGKLSNAEIKDAYIYKRAQYVDMLINSEQFFKKHLMV